MAKSSTLYTGDLFEKSAFDLLNDLLQNEEFYVSGKSSIIFLKKKYYSSRRKDDIVCDISIETYIPGSGKYSFLTIIECKKLSRSVSVDDIEEFESKVRQIGEHNTKGIFITNRAFQEGAYNLAVSLGIGLVRLTTNDKFEWINYRKENTVLNIDKRQIASRFVSDESVNDKFIAYIKDKVMTNFAEVLLTANVIDFYIHKEKYINIPFLTDFQIGVIVKRLTKYDIYSGVRLNTTKLCQFLTTVYPVTFEFTSD